MARTAIGPRLEPSATDKRPVPLAISSLGFWAAIHADVETIQYDKNSVIMLPDGFSEDEDDQIRWRERGGERHCWRTTAIYEHIGQNHPHLVTYLRRDPWTAYPILAKTSGPPLADFFEQHKDNMYSGPLEAPSSRILLPYRALMFQWTLHLISGLAFVHGKEVVVGDLSLRNCWLSSGPKLSLSLVGFPHAGFKYSVYGGYVYEGEDRIFEDWSILPTHTPHFPNTQTDIFLYGCVVYQLMTGTWPNSPSQQPAPGPRMPEPKPPRGVWPSLEADYMGEIVRKCWACEYEDADVVKAAVVEFMEGLGWEVEGGNDLKGLDVTTLFPDEVRGSAPVNPNEGDTEQINLGALEV